MRTLSERFYLFIVGLIVVGSLYFEQQPIIYGLCAWLLLESIVNFRVPKLLQKASKVSFSPDMRIPHKPHRFEIPAIRAWHIMVAIILYSTYALVNYYSLELLWPLPWMLGLTALAAGITNSCPPCSLLVYAGFKHA